MSDEPLLLRRQRHAFRDWLRSVDPHCLYCGRHLKAKGTTLDHVVPISRGGTHHIGNLALACLLCNAAKRERTPAEWLQDLQQACDRIAARRVISPEITSFISPEIKIIPPTSKDA